MKQYIVTVPVRITQSALIDFLVEADNPKEAQLLANKWEAEELDEYNHIIVERELYDPILVRDSL